MRVLVTGGAGFIASQVATAYVESGHEVVVVDNLCSGKLENVPSGARLEQLDVRSADAARLIEDFRPEVINHHAAQMSVTASVADPVFDAEVNIIGLLNVLGAAAKASTKKFIFSASGGTVYANPRSIPADESQGGVPLSPYGISKLAGEHYLQFYRRVHGIQTITLRYANVYGPRQDPHGEAGVIAIFSQRLLADEPVTIYGDGEQTRDYVFVGDVVRANVACLDADFTGEVNVGTATETTVNELYDRLRDITGSSSEAVHAEERGGEVRRTAVDVSLAREVLGWKPATDLDTGLSSTVDFFRARS